MSLLCNTSGREGLVVFWYEKILIKENWKARKIFWLWFMETNSSLPKWQTIGAIQYYQCYNLISSTSLIWTYSLAFFSSVVSNLNAEFMMIGGGPLGI